MNRTTTSTCIVGVWLALAVGSTAAEPLDWIAVSPDGRGFVYESSGEAFVPRGVNYDHDEHGRLIEDYWHEEWPKVEEDFAEIKALGANLVRIHLQLGRFLPEADKPDAVQLDRLGELVALAERQGLYVDMTGLGCYHQQDVPAWYDELDEAGRWQAQAVFWEAVAARCAGSPAVFCYDLMNEPVSPAGQRERRAWLGPAFAGKHFVQMISLEQGDRTRPEIARAWIQQLTSAIRRHDARHLVTVGLVDWSLDRPGLTSGFVPREIAPELDFLAVHIYPERGNVQDALETLAAFDVGKPVLIEETFPLKCGLDDFEQFLGGSRPHAAGWVSFYWGRTAAECRQGTTLADAVVAGYLDWFAREAEAPAAQPAP